MATEARALFVERYRTQVRPEFERVDLECRGEVERLFAASEMLTALTADPDFFDSHRKLLAPARFLTKPVISADTLKIVGEQEGTTETIQAFLDRERFPWLPENRSVEAVDAEVQQAIRITARLMAEQRAATAQRIALSRAQELAVREELEKAGLVYVEPKTIRKRLKELGDDVKEGVSRTNYQEALGRGEFTREIAIAGAKCDVPIRLVNGDLMPIECKVSNSEVNSVKRLSRETGGKHERWRGAFGSELRTVAVLGGVFNPRTLAQAQEDGIAIVFDHDLDPLQALVATGS